MSSRGRLLHKSRVGTLLEDLCRNWTVVAPVLRRGFPVMAVPAPGEEVALDSLLSKTPSKSLVLPPREVLLCSGSGDDPEPGARRPVLLFGVRPCDARALRFLDRVFLEGPVIDGCYHARRKAMLVVSLACAHPRETCFCTAVGGDPYGEEGSDILLVEEGDGYVARGVTPQGEALLVSLGLPVAKDPPPEAEPAPVRESPDPHRTAEALQRAFESPRWKALTEKCLGCGVCTYLCPTCHCFDLQDEGGVAVTVRCRVWDSCQFPDFTRQASGHNPRPTQMERHRQRILHKFSYSLANHGMPGCVGCGRCVRECPVNLDIREVLGALSGGEGPWT